MKFGPFLPTQNKLTNFWGPDLESRIQFWSKLSTAFQCDKIKGLWKLTFKRKETTNLCVLLLKGDAKLAENVTITFQNDRCNMVNLM